MTTPDFTTTLLVTQSLEQAFQAINVSMYKLITEGSGMPEK
jgi:hypothetical protein